MQKEQINVCRLKYTILFHVIEKSVKKNDQRQQKDISSELLNTLIMYREPSDYASPIQPPVSQHRCCNIYIFTPLSDRTLEGHPFLSTAATKSACTVAARLFVEQLKYTMSLEKPSIPMYHKPPTDEAMQSINVPKRIRSPDTVNMPSDCVKPSQRPSNRINSNHT